MSDYYPNGWALVKVTGSDPHYKVFGSWRGGFAAGDSWRMNSGITSVTKENNKFIFKGASGSQYICDKESYGALGFYNSTILEDYCNKSDLLSYLKEMPEDIMSIDWIIK